MKFLIMGSTKSIAEKDKDDFIQACHELGKRLAERRHTIIISSSDPETADLYVLEGVVEVSSASDRRPVILLQSPEKNDLKVLDKYKNVVDLQQQPIGELWPSNRIQAIGKADAVILIAGHFGVAAVGAAAPLLKTPVVAVASFEGAARQIWQDASVYYGQAGISPDDVATLGRKWRSNCADIVVNVAEMLVKKNPFRQDRVLQNLVAISIIVLLVAWVSLYLIGGQNPNDYVLFILLGISALIGTGLRTGLREIGLLENLMGSLSGQQIRAEAIVGLLLAFVFFLFYITGNFVLTGTFITLQGKPATDFSRVAITLTLLGIASAFLIEPATVSIRKRLEELIANTPKK